jgi:methylase of polypeptide subunit release factors
VTTARPADIRSQVFGPLVIRYDERVLTPRPWTLMQSLWAAELAAQATTGPILELCAGAGQIGLAAAALTGRALVQVEADPVAAGYARTNAAAAGRDSQVEVRNARIQTGVAAGERFSIILADPPYLLTADVARWPNDPVSAIDGGTDGLDLTRVCLQVAAAHLTPGGAMLLQVAGEPQARAVVAVLEQSASLGLTHLETRHHDHDRAVMLLTGGSRKQVGEVGARYAVRVNVQVTPSAATRPGSAAGTY